MSNFPPPPPPPGQPNWGPQLNPDFDAPNQGWPQGAPQMPVGGYGPSGDHPDGTKALIISLISLLCCSPLEIWSFLIASKARSEGSTDGKITAAYIISIVVGVLFTLTLLGWAAMFAMSV